MRFVPSQEPRVALISFLSFFEDVRSTDVYEEQSLIFYEIEDEIEEGFEASEL